VGRIIAREAKANVGKIMMEKTTGAWITAEARIAAAQRRALAIKYLLCINVFLFVACAA
jgi:hypothetical protein